MGFSFIGSAEAFAGGGGTSLACSTTLNVATGDLLVANVGWEDGTGGTIGISDGGSNILTMSSVVNKNAEDYMAFGYKLSAVANVSATFTFTNSTSRGYRQVFVLQFRPDAGDTVSLDPAAGNPNILDGYTAGDTVFSGDITTEGTDGVAVGAQINYDNSVTYTSPQIGDVAATGSIASSGTQNRAWYRLLTAPMTNAHAQVSMQNGKAWSPLTGIIAFKAVAAGGSPPSWLSISRSRLVNAGITGGLSRSSLANGGY